MNRTLIVMAALVLAGVSAWPIAVAHGPSLVHVTVRDMEYDPDRLVISPGTNVSWFNEGPSPHTVASHYHGDQPVSGETAVSLDPAAEADDFHGMLMAEDDPETEDVDERVFNHTFEVPGVYVINCNLGGDHEDMKMVILVIDE